jgi:predicted lipoprotein
MSIFFFISAYSQIFVASRQIRFSHRAAAAFIAALFLGFGVQSCNNNSSGPNEDDKKFDRAVFLRETATNLIVPAYRDTRERIAALQSATERFAASPENQTLQEARQAWILAYTTWLRAAPFDFGPAESPFGTLRENIAVFPINPRLTEQFIAESRTDLNNFNRDTRGLLGIEYLLFAANVQETIRLFTADENAAKRRAYLAAIMNDVKKRVDATAEPWLRAGDASFVEEFARNNGTSVGTSTSMLFNEFVKSYEALKNFKIGVPFGFRAGQTVAAPQNIEAPYSQMSLEFMRIHLQIIEDVWAGKTTTATGGTLDFTGFEEYLASVQGGAELITATKNQLTQLKTALENVPTTPTLSELITQNHPSLRVLHDEAQKMTRFFKSDMSSLLGISITFSSGDGD